MRIHIQLRRLFVLLSIVGLLMVSLINNVLAQGGQENLPSGEWIAIALNARNDLELLATASLFTASTRPEGWSGSFDINDPQLPLLVRLDLELLAGTLLGADIRPEDWFGAVPSTTNAWARDIRHDLELLADVLLEGARPSDWVGAPPLMQCDRVTQAAANLLERDGLYSLQADRTAANFCDQARNEVSLFIENNLLVETSATTSTPVALGTGNITNSIFTIGFYNRSATRKAGVIPINTPFTPVSRSATQFSNMMLIRGDGFTVYVDYLFYRSHTQ